MERGTCALAIVAICALLPGCVSAPPAVPNPLTVQARSLEEVWNATVQVLDNYFDIAKEDRVTGRIETRPQVAATLLEPWRRDGLDLADRLEATLQSERRRAIATVREVTPGQYTVSVEVYKELEDLAVPARSPTGHALFRSEPSLHREYAVVTGDPVSSNWINLGRDWKLEAQILSDLAMRLGSPPPPTTP